jgi:uncharacterized membrane protein
MKKYAWSIPMTVLAIVASVWALPQLPEVITTNARFNSASISAGMLVMLIPTVMLLILGLTVILGNYAGRKSSLARTVEPVTAMMNTVQFGLMLTHGLLLAYGMGVKMDEQIIGPLVTGIVYIGIGNYLPLIRHNPIRALAGHDVPLQESAWRQTRRTMGIVFILGGLLMILSALLPGGLMLPFFLALVILTSVVLTVNFYKFYQKTLTGKL